MIEWLMLDTFQDLRSYRIDLDARFGLASSIPLGLSRFHFPPSVFFSKELGFSEHTEVPRQIQKPSQGKTAFADFPPSREDKDGSVGF